MRFIVFLFLLIITPVFSQAEESPWSLEFAPSEVRGDPILHMTIHEGELVVSGVHGLQPSQEIQGIARWDGQHWHAMGALPEAFKVHVLEDLDGDLLVGGEWEPAGSEGSPLLRWDGESWQPVGPGLRGAVRALIRWRGKWVVAGRCEVMGRPKIRNVAIWDGQDWEAVPAAGLAGGYNSIQALTVFRGDLVVGGFFAEVAGVASANVALYDGKNWKGLAGGASAEVTSLAVYQDQLVAAGAFLEVGGQAIAYLARWDGEAWQGLGDGFELREGYHGRGKLTFLQVRDGCLLVGGDFVRVGGVPAFGLATWNGREWKGGYAPLDVTQVDLPTWDWGSLEVSDLEALPGKRGEEIRERWEEDRTSAPLEMVVFQGAPIVTSSMISLYPLSRNSIPVDCPRLGAWRHQRWEPLAWDQVRIYQSSSLLPLAGGRLARFSMGRAELAMMWEMREGRWELGARFPDDLSGKPRLMGQAAAGDQVFALLRNGTPWQLFEYTVFRREGDRFQVIGEPILARHLVAHLAVGESRIMLVLGDASSYRSEHSVTWLLDGERWRPLTDAPNFGHVKDVVAFGDAIFVAGSQEREIPYGVESSPTIWKYDGNDWQKQWSHDSGELVSFSRGHGQLRIGLSQTQLHETPLPPVLTLAGDEWRSEGGILVEDIRQGLSARVHHVFEHAGRVFVQGGFRDMAHPEVKASEGVLFWENGCWQRWSPGGLTSASFFLEDARGRLWVGDPFTHEQFHVPLICYEGDVVSSSSLVPEQWDLWWALPEDQRPPPRPPGPETASVIGLPESPHLTLPNGLRIPGHLGWDLRPKRGFRGQVQADQIGPNMEASFLGKVQALEHKALAQEGNWQRVSFRFRLREFKRGDGIPRASLAYHSKERELQDLVKVDLDFRVLPPDSTGFRSVSMLVATLADTAWVSWRLDLKEVKEEQGFAIRDLKFETMDREPAPFVPEVLDVLTTQLRNIDGYSPVLATENQAELYALSPLTHWERKRAYNRILRGVRSRRELPVPMQGLFKTRNERREWFDRQNERNRKRLVHFRHQCGWLPGNTFYLAVKDLNDLANVLSKESSVFSVRDLGPDTRLILDLRADPQRDSIGQDPGHRAWRWATLWNLMGNFLTEEAVLWGYRGTVGFLPGNEGFPNLEWDTEDPGLAWYRGAPGEKILAIRELIIPTNPWTDALLVQALSRCRNAVIIGEEPMLLHQPRATHLMPSGYSFAYPCGIYLNSVGESLHLAGVKPDIPVEWRGERDRVWDALLHYLE